MNFLSKMCGRKPIPLGLVIHFCRVVGYFRLALGWMAPRSRARLLPRKLQCRLYAIAQILKKILRRYIQNRMSQKLSITAKP